MTLAVFSGFTPSPSGRRQGWGQAQEHFLLSCLVPGAPFPTFAQRGKK